MSLLSVSSITNPSAGQPNILLNADGSVTLPVYTGSSAPLQFQAGTLWFNTTGPSLQIRNPSNTAWVAVGGGGGSGTVTSVGGTAPISVATPTTTPVISIAAATTGATGAVQLADATASKAGTSATLVSTPAFSVPKDAANMTGAALLPSGNNTQRTAITGLTAGMTRFNTDYTPDSLEVYDGTNWKQLAYVATPPSPLTDLTISANGPLSSGTYNNVTINSGVTATVSGTTTIRAYGTVTINGNINGDAEGYKGFSLTAGSQVMAVGVTAGLGAGYGSLGNVISQSYSFKTFSGSTGGVGTLVPQSTASFCSGKAGSAGATLIVISDGPINIGATSSISVNGGAGSIGGGGGPNLVGGSGGGSGGLILLQSSTSLSLAAGSTLSAAGGNGSNGFSSDGGGGGGGGYIVLNSPSTTDSSTKTLSGGSAGASGAGQPGGSGGAFGGAGGRGGDGAGNNPAAGSSGQLLLNEYI